MLPVPTAGIIAAIAVMFIHELPAAPPKAAAKISAGRFHSPFTTLRVPASSELRAETRVALPHPLLV